jgi:hypothetical protein
MYFHQTENIAGIRDARFQTMMPDALSWLGISRIDWLLSMSGDKYDAIVDAGIQVMQRVSLPDAWVPPNAWVELDAKVMSGYHSEGKTIDRDEVQKMLFQLPTIRERCGKLYNLAQRGLLSHFILDESKLQKAVDLTVDVILRTYPLLDIPAHSRTRHFKKTSLENLQNSWPGDAVEKTRRMVDLCTVSVLLDAGAGPDWKYVSPTDGQLYTRSEGLGQASLDMFAEGVFSSDPAVKSRANSVGLMNLKLDQVKRGLQVRKDNTLVGLDGRVGLLNRLGQALESFPEYFGPYEIYRPGNIVDYILKHADPVTKEVSVEVLWTAMITGFQSVWPTLSSGIRRGDVWMHTKLKSPNQTASDLVPFHKLTQWLMYSIIEVLETNLGIKFPDTGKLTCLAEYRNGGLLVDSGVLRLREPRMATFGVHVGSELVVEWRALTIILIDKMAVDIRKKLGKDLSMSQILEGGTWRAGRELAFSLRTGGVPPILVESDGTVF